MVSIGSMSMYTGAKTVVRTAYGNVALCFYRHVIGVSVSSSCGGGGVGDCLLVGITQQKAVC